MKTTLAITTVLAAASAVSAGSLRARQLEVSIIL